MWNNISLLQCEVSWYCPALQSWVFWVSSLMHCIFISGSLDSPANFYVLCVCVCVCVWSEQCFCGQISEKHVFSSCALSLSFNSIHSLSCQILFSTCNVATFVSIFLHGAGFSVSHCKTASPPCCHKNVVPNFLQKIENFFFLLYFLNPLPVCSIGNME